MLISRSQEKLDKVASEISMVFSYFAFTVLELFIMQNVCL